VSQSNQTVAQPPIAIVLADQPLSGQAQPSASRTDYLEGVNASGDWSPSAPSYSFESFFRTESRNDKVGWLSF
jgi:hypothetical protein